MKFKSTPIDGIKTPVQVLHGGFDTFVSVSNSQR